MNECYVNNFYTFKNTIFFFKLRNSIRREGCKTKVLKLYNIIVWAPLKFGLFRSKNDELYYVIHSAFWTCSWTNIQNCNLHKKVTRRFTSKIKVSTMLANYINLSWLGIVIKTFIITNQLTIVKLINWILSLSINT